MKSIVKTIAGIGALVFTLNANAQNSSLNSLETGTSYTTAIGLRGGGTSGLTIKHFYADQRAYEFIVNGWYNGIGVTGLLEKHQTAFNEAGLNWYFGVGGHVSVGASRAYYYGWNDRYVAYSDGRVALGVDGIVGLEYAIPRIPLALSLDVKPFAEVTTNGNVWLAVDPGLGVKFTF